MIRKNIFLLWSDYVSRKTRRIVLILFALAVALRIFFIFATPAFPIEPKGNLHPFNDEYFHYKYIAYLIENHSFPVPHHFREPDDPELIEVMWIFHEAEYPQSPLYYVLSMPFAMLDHPMIACRIFSLILSSALLLVALSCVVLIFKRKDSAALIAIGLLGFHPVLVRIGSSISNDNLSWLLSMILFYVYLNRRFADSKLLFGLLIGLGILTRISFLLWIIFLLAKPVVEFLWWRQKDLAISRIRASAWIASVALLISGSWLIRNQMIYGDWTGVEALGWRSYLYTGSLDALKNFLDASLRFSFFPIAEEPVAGIFLPVSFFVFALCSFFLQYRLIRSEFENSALFGDFVLFSFLNVVVFLMTNLRWNHPEARHLLIGLLPFAAILIAALRINFNRAAAPLAIAFNLVCLLAWAW